MCVINTSTSIVVTLKWNSRYYRLKIISSYWKVTSQMITRKRKADSYPVVILHLIRNFQNAPCPRTAYLISLQILSAKIVSSQNRDWVRVWEKSTSNRHLFLEANVYFFLHKHFSCVIDLIWHGFAVRYKIRYMVCCERANESLGYHFC